MVGTKSPLREEIFLGHLHFRFAPIPAWSFNRKREITVGCARKST
jgi:hypothetical protein